ncbi:MAG: 50S ribosomal protein L23 [Puniceicoccales bacterium]|jgi:large subunit ribosomal protein L23|nr:50S ribosomal protein L23 [Puniceicoccales bacterium]
MAEGREILRGFWLTEKSTLLSSSRNQYVFRVALDATREAVAQAIRRVFNVTPLRVNLLRRKGKVRKLRVTRRQSATVREPDEKKAFVSLRADDKIEIF